MGLPIKLLISTIDLNSSTSMLWLAHAGFYKQYTSGVHCIYFVVFL